MATFTNRVYDVIDNNFVEWDTQPDPDPAGVSYTGSGVFGVDTSDYTVLRKSGAASGGSYSQTFVDGDLTAGVLTVNHSLGVDITNVAIKTNTDEAVEADGITYTDTLNLDVDLSSFGVLVGTWKVLVSA